MAPAFTSERDDDVVIVTALRTPICKAKRGGFKDTLPDDLLCAVFEAVVKQSGIQPSMVEDICVGNVDTPGAALMARIAQLLSGIPDRVPIYTTNRQCSSGLQAVMNIANEISTGRIDIGIAGGVECMTLTPMGAPPGFALNPRVADSELAQQCLTPMGITSENVAADYNIDRETQDKFAVLSHEKAARAQSNGWFDDEIVPVQTKLVDTDGSEKMVTISKDDGIRAGTTMQVLGKLKPAFMPGGSTTAGNSSQVSDGAAACLLARRSVARKHNLPVLGVIRSFAVTGVPPRVMGIGPAYAIPEALKKAGLKMEDIDIYEINEAFASQASYSVNKLGIPMDKVNPKGGAIALGHPLGCTGARQVATLLHELKRRGQRAYGVISMCIGTGMGAAAVIEYPGRTAASKL